MTFDRTKVEEWVVGSGGFWRKGDINPDQFYVPFTGTWDQVRDRRVAMADMERRHFDERVALRERQQEERKQLWGESP